MQRGYAYFNVSFEATKHKHRHLL